MSSSSCSTPRVVMAGSGRKRLLMELELSTRMRTGIWGEGGGFRGESVWREGKRRGEKEGMWVWVGER